jgi:hypothetical protein
MQVDTAMAAGATRIQRTATPAIQPTHDRNSMLSKWQYSLLVVLGALALLLAIANGVLFTQNRTLQAALNQRQAFVQQTVPLEGLYNDIVKTLAQMGVKGNDREVLNMLAAHGLTVTVNAPAADAAASAPAARSDKK